MPLTPTEEKLKSLFEKYENYSPRRAQEAALFIMRGEASYGEITRTVPDTQTTHTGKALDLAAIEAALKEDAKAKGGE